MQPYTEASNPISTDIDISNPAEIVQKLQLCDTEMFQPKGLGDDVKVLHSDSIVKAITEIAKLAKDFLSEQSRDSLLLMSGCGTSGRIAFMMARTYNQLLGTKKLAYTIAGGDKALFTSQEAPEDDHQSGRNDLITACKGKRRVLYIGITCGLSAPYVAGQLDHCMSNLDVFTPVLLGFNPINLARNLPIFNWNKTFLNVAEAMEELAGQGKAFVVNPVLMGEAITGSSRMKGGSVTKVILDTIFLLATSSMTSFTTSDCHVILRSYEFTCKNLYQSASSLISSLLQCGGDSLKSGGHIYYAGSGGTGVLGIIDATECTPTYGSDLNDVRGFIHGGYSKYDNNEGDIGHFGENYRIDTNDLADLLESVDPESVANNTIVVSVTGKDDPLLKEIQETSKLGARLKEICASQTKKSVVKMVLLLNEQCDAPDVPGYFSDINTLCLSSCDEISKLHASLLTPNGRTRHEQSMLEFYSKWLYNGISTGAHVLKGKVLKNYMVDLKVSNQKLFHRSIGIIQRFCPNISKDEARDYLLCSIYEKDTIDPSLKKESTPSHILEATPKDKVVPTAIVMATKKCRFDEAQNLLEQHHVIREALAKLTCTS